MLNLADEVAVEAKLAQEAGTAVRNDAVGVKAATGARRSIHGILLGRSAPPPRRPRGLGRDSA